MDEKTRDRLTHIAQYSSEDIGSSEEGVKLKFIVELLFKLILLSQRVI